MSEVDYEKLFSSQEAEQLLGVPRSRFKHYINKGLLNINKDEVSGYYKYSYEDIILLCQLIYYRDVLGYSIERINEILNTVDIQEIQRIANDQVGFLADEIETRQRQLNMVGFNQKLISRLHTYKDKIALIHFGTAYLLPDTIGLKSNSVLWPITYEASEFHFDGELVTYKDKWTMVYEEDFRFLDERAVDEANRIGKKIHHDLCVYNVSLSKKKTSGQALVQPALHWAIKHRHYIKGPIYLAHFFPYYSEGTAHRYVEAILPIEIL